MLAEFLEVLQKIGGSFLPFVVVTEWQRGVILRFGRFRREVGPGFHWMVPFADSPVIVSSVVTTTALRAQSVVTKDGKVITAEAVVRWSVQDVRTVTLSTWDVDNVIIDGAQGAIADALRSIEFDSPDMSKKVYSDCKKTLARYGIKVEAVTFTTLAPVRVLRLIGTQPPATDANMTS